MENLITRYGVVIVREIAGHSDIKVTMTVYAHGNLDEHAAALSQLGGVLSGGLLSAAVVNQPDDDHA
ncbi:MAG: hypothetical protein WKF73_18995 [Nocardioidaceae bacterium]|jgi:integrase